MTAQMYMWIVKVEWHFERERDAKGLIEDLREDDWLEDDSKKGEPEIHVYRDI